MDKKRPSEAADDLVFKAIANADRRRLLDELREGGRTTGDLCDVLPHLERTTVMQHLRVLVEAGLVIVRREGRVRWNHLDVTPIQAIHERWIGEYARPAASLLTKIKRRLEDE